MDGGTIRNVNTLSAIEQCMQIVDDESKITIDVMVCGGDNSASETTDDHNTVGWWWRARYLDDAYSGPNIFRQDMVSHPKVNWRYAAWQIDNHFGGISEIEFDGDKTWPLQEQGRQDAQTLLAAGENRYFEHLADWHDSKALRDEFPMFISYLKTLQ